MSYNELQVKDENLHSEIFQIFDDNDVTSYKDYKKLNIINKLKIQNNIVEILKLHDDDDDLYNINTLKGLIIVFINSFNHLNYIGGK